MKIVAISDFHGFFPLVPPCDLLLIAGDVCPMKNHNVDFQAGWLDTDFRYWLRSLTHVGQVIGIAGNHDFVFERAPQRVPGDLSWIYLQDSATEFTGLKFWGTPWQPWFHDWAFNGRPDLLKEKWALIPNDTDVLVVHGPPLSIGDGVPERGGVRHTGCPHLLQRIEEIKPRLVVFGHIHPGAGVYVHGTTLLVNASLLDDSYRMVHEPTVLLLDVEKKTMVVTSAPGLPLGERLEVAWTR
jgi:predicted phosphodiesterase